MLIAARISQRVRNRLAPSLILLRNISAIFPAMQFTSSLKPSFLGRVDCAHGQCSAASSNWPNSAWAAAKYDNHDGGKNVAPVDRNAMIAEVIIWTASEPLPVRAKSQPCKNVPSAFQNTTERR